MVQVWIFLLKSKIAYSSKLFVCFLLMLYCGAVRDGDTVKHYRIRQLDEGGFFIARRTTFRTLQELVEHYSKDADGLCVNLRKPCVQVSESFLLVKYEMMNLISYLCSPVSSMG